MAPVDCIPENVSLASCTGGSGLLPGVWRDPGVLTASSPGVVFAIGRRCRLSPVAGPAGSGLSAGTAAPVFLFTGFLPGVHFAFVPGSPPSRIFLVQYSLKDLHLPAPFHHPAQRGPALSKPFGTQITKHFRPPMRRGCRPTPRTILSQSHRACLHRILLHYHSRAVRQQLGHRLPDLGGVELHADHRIGAELPRMVASRSSACSRDWFKSSVSLVDLAADKGAEPCRNVPAEPPAPHDQAPREPEGLCDLIAGQYGVLTMMISFVKGFTGIRIVSEILDILSRPAGQGATAGRKREAVSIPRADVVRG